MALVLDMDGVIVDSNPLHAEAWMLYNRRFGIDAGEALAERMYGRRNDEIVRDFFGPRLSAEEVAAHGAARQAVAAFPNAYIYHNNGRDLTAIRRRWWHRFGLGPKLQFDFAFSCLVFQHIPSLDVIEGYVREVNRLLRPRALFKFQVQGDP